MVTTEVKGSLWSFLPLVVLWSDVFTSGSLFCYYHAHAHKGAHVHDAQSCCGFMYFTDQQLNNVATQAKNKIAYKQTWM